MRPLLMRAGKTARVLCMPARTLDSTARREHPAARRECFTGSSCSNRCPGPSCVVCRTDSAVSKAQVCCNLQDSHALCAVVHQAHALRAADDEEDSADGDCGTRGVRMRRGTGMRSIAARQCVRGRAQNGRAGASAAAATCPAGARARGLARARDVRVGWSASRAPVDNAAAGNAPLTAPDASKVFAAVGFFTSVKVTPCTQAAKGGRAR